MDPKPRIRVDFNEMFEDGTIDLRPAEKDIQAIKERLQSGIAVVLSDEEDMEVDARLYYNDKYAMWVGVPEWATRRRPKGTNDKA